jgi:hypothetical protein
MALEDKIDKLTATLERLLDAMKATTGSAPGNVVQDDGPALLNSQVEAPTPAKPRGRPRKPVEPVNTAPPVEEPGEISPDEEAQETAEAEAFGEYSPEPETVAPAIVAVPPAPTVTETEAREAMLKLHAAFGKEPAKAILSSFGLAKLAEIQGKPDVWAPMHAAALARIAELSDDGI